MSIYDYIAKWDPMGLIQSGYPKDEYRSEAFEIIFQYRTSMTEADVAELVHRVFVERLELDPKGFKEQTLERSGELKRILEQEAEKSDFQ